MLTNFTPTTGIAYVLYVLRNSVAASSTWQGLVGVTTEAAAIPSVHYAFAVDDDLDSANFPRCIVGVEDYTKSRVGFGTYSCGGTASVAFQFVVPSEQDDQDAEAWLLEQCEKTLNDMLSQGEAGGEYLNMFEFSFEAADILEPENGNPTLDDGRIPWGANWLVRFPQSGGAG